MSDENQMSLKDRKELLKEKKELKMLERFQYDPRAKRNRDSNNKNINTNNIHISFIAGTSSDKKLIAKKRGRKPKNILSSFSEKPFGKKRGRKRKNLMPHSDIKPESSIFSNDDRSLKIIKNVVNSQALNFQSESNKSVSIKQNSFGSLSLPIQLERDNSQIIQQNNYYEVRDSNGNKNQGLNTKTEGSEENSPEQFILDKKEYLETEFPREIEKYKNQYNLKENGISRHHDSSGNISSLQQENITNLKSSTFINCDLRFFNFEFITQRTGYFDVIMIDPPWRIKGGQRNDSSFMFSNSKFNLEYNTLSNNEIISLPVEKLSNKGK